MKRFRIMQAFSIAVTLNIVTLVAFTFAEQNNGVVKSKHLVLTGNHSFPAKPLDTLTVKSQHKGKVEVSDGMGKVYVSKSIDDTLEFVTGGALGTQMIVLSEPSGRVVDRLSFRVNCRTEIEDELGHYKELLDVLYHSMTGGGDREASIYRYDGKDYHVFVGWLRDHVHTLKGMKYFYPELKTGIDLYADSQRKDGMIWDNYTHSWTKEESSYWVQRFRYGDFVRISEEDQKVFTRIPVENDVEYLFIEGIYFTWKATGDDEWMEGMLDKALKAVEYSHNDPLRWSEKYGLLKRGYTIDTWDFQNNIDAAISVGEGNPPDPMIIKKDHTRFGIMFGDNTGMAAACGFLAEMLDYTGREKEASEIRQFGLEIKERVDSLSWNGRFFRHHVPEDENIVRDLGVNESIQVSLSNAYSLNRTVTHEQAVQIIRTYQRIREEMPDSSPGEFYTIYPPFNKGYGGHNTKWAYMNGGVTSIVAGELAHGAFEHGFEKYGVDILDRMLKLAKQTYNYLHCTYRGKIPEEPEREFETLDLRNIANTDFYGNTIEGVMGWTNEGKNDLHEFPTGKQNFEGVPFDVIDPAENGRRACLGMSSKPGYSMQSTLAVNRKAESLYFLHAINNNYYAGRITLVYADGSRFSDEIGPGKVLNWWYPPAQFNGKQMLQMKVAWRGKNTMSENIGVTIYGLNNPHPDKTIDRIEFTSAENGAKWMILGVTISDYPVFFKPGIVSGGIPDNWGAAAVVYALIEGLAGVKDLGVAYDRVLISPRWEAAGVNKASATITYEASGAYTAYTYQYFNDKIRMTFTGNGKHTDLQLLLPDNTKIKRVLLDDQSVSFETFQVESSEYVKITSPDHGVHQLIVELVK